VRTIEYKIFGKLINNLENTILKLVIIFTFLKMEMDLGPEEILKITT
jgi:hypothetical protein